MRPAALRAKSSTGCAPLCEAARLRFQLLEPSAFVAGDLSGGRAARCCWRTHTCPPLRGGGWGARARGDLYEKRPMDRQRRRCPAPGQRAARRRPWRLRRREGLALAARGLWPRAARAAPTRGPPSARGADGGPPPTRWSAARGRAPLGPRATSYDGPRPHRHTAIHRRKPWAVLCLASEPPVWLCQLCAESVYPPSRVL